MKKKILSLSIVLILFIILGVLTGCGNKDDVEENKQNSSSSVGNIQAEVTSSGIEISSVITKFSDGIAEVQDSNDNKYVIDESGKVIYEVKENEEVLVRNGYITVNKHYIYDKNGEQIANDEERVYSVVSKSGYVLVKYETEDISGTTYYVQIEDLDGNKVSETYKTRDDEDDSGSYYLFEDYFVIFHRDYDNDVSEFLMINASNKEIQTIDEDYYGVEVENLDNGWYSLKGTTGLNVLVNSDFSVQLSNGRIFPNENSDYPEVCYESTFVKMVGDKYRLVKRSSYGYALLDLDDNVLIGFKDRGDISSIEYLNDTFYVISGTGYIYTMDSNMEYVVQPTTTEYNGLIKVNDKIYASKEDENGNYAFYLLNENLEVQKEISTGCSSTSANPNLSTVIGTDFIYGNSFVIFNIEKEEILKIYK